MQGARGTRFRLIVCVRCRVDWEGGREELSVGRSIRLAKGVAGGVEKASSSAKRKVHPTNPTTKEYNNNHFDL